MGGWRVGRGGLIKDSQRVPNTLPSVDLATFLWTSFIGQIISIAVVQGLRHLAIEKCRVKCGKRSSPPPIFESKLSVKRVDVVGEK